MYYYIVDPQNLSQKDFERVQNVLYSSLSEFRISGEVMRVTGLRTVQQLVENAFAHDAKTIVAVGGDETLHEVVNAVGLREMTVGYIPLQNSPLATTFGLKDVLQAVKTIASRRIEELDLGIINGNYFLTKITFANGHDLEIIFSADDEFKAQIKASQVEINNIDYPSDGRLDVYFFQDPPSIWQKLFRKNPQPSILHVKKIEILSPEGLALKLENKTLAKTPVLIEVVPKAMKMIVGKERVF